jgi:hypothetical protein
LGRINEATDETRLDMADKAKISTEGVLLEAEVELGASDHAQLWGPSEDFQFAGSNVGMCGGSFTVATPLYCQLVSIYLKENKVCLPWLAPSPSA